MVDTIMLDISEFDKDITYEYSEGNILVKYNLSFPPHSGFKSFELDEDAQAFIKKIRKEGDKVKYK